MSPQIQLLCVTFLAACLVVRSHSRVLYVKADNGPPCSHGIHGPIQCKTLEWYSNHSDIFFTSNTEMVFLNGTHSLETFIEVHNCHNFTMIGNGGASLRSDGLPQPTSLINCHGAFRSGLLFINSSEIHISNLGLDSCSGNTTFENSTIYFALAFGWVGNLTMFQVVINNTRGYGLYCISVFGEISVNESAFMNARGDNKALVYGGNAEFSFNYPCSSSSSNLIIYTSWFMYGEETSFRFYSASGLQILIFCSKVHVIIDKVTAHGNKGIAGGNIALTIADFGYEVRAIIIRNSCISSGWAEKGGGINFWSIAKANSNLLNNYHNITILNISNSMFSNNEVSETGGAMHIEHYEAESNLNNFRSYRLRQIRITNCTFVGNKGNGAAMEILEQTTPGYIPHIMPQFRVYFGSCGFYNNSVTSDKYSSIMVLIGIKDMWLSNCNFTNSHGSVFSLLSSNLNFLGSIHFENNSAVYGGAIKVCDSSLINLHNWTKVTFINNRAQRGGAIYAQQGCLDTAPACIFQPAINTAVPIEDFDKFMKLKFVNNSARDAGDAIYGGSIDFCYTLKAFSFDGTSSPSLFNSKYIFRMVFDVAEQNSSFNISSNPRGVCFCDPINRRELCRLAVANLTKYPGEKFNVSVTTVGQFNGSTIGIIEAQVDSTVHSTNELISLNNPSIHKGCVNLTYKVHSSGSITMIINFAAISADVNAYYSHGNASLSLSLLPCPLGFKLTDNNWCDCDPLLQSNDILSPVKCDIDTQVIHIPTKSQVWFGCDSNESDRDNQSQCYLTVNLYCSHYCTSYSHNVSMSTPTHLDDQCLPGRTGILCGACKPGLSRVLGSPTKCKPCSNRNLLFLIPIFLLSGIFIVMLLTILNLTVTEGTINGLIIYANIMFIHRPHFQNGSHIINKICWVFIAWLNFDVGLEFCFYKGMDGYQQIWLLYGFILYLIAVQLVIIVLCRRFLLFTRLLGRNVTNVLATLLFLMYSPLTCTVMHSLQCTHLQISTPNGTEKRLVWYFDGNVPCYGAKHIPLFIVGLSCTIAVVWFTFSLLLVQCLRRRANLFCFGWVEKLRPFFEAYSGPCHDSYRFWPGFLIFMRLGLYIPYILNATNVTNIKSLHQHKLTSFGTPVVCITILSFSCIFPHGVYKKWPLNMLEFSFFLNLCITSALWVIFEDHHYCSVVITSVCIAALTFLGILAHHVGVKWRAKVTICRCLKLKIWLIKLAPFKHQIGVCCFPSDKDDTAPILPQPLPPVVQYGHYREPLIGDTNN